MPMVHAESSCRRRLPCACASVHARPMRFSSSGCGGRGHWVVYASCDAEVILGITAPILGIMAPIIGITASTIGITAPTIGIMAPTNGNKNNVTDNRNNGTDAMRGRSCEGALRRRGEDCTGRATLRRLSHGTVSLLVVARRGRRWNCAGELGGAGLRGPDLQGLGSQRRLLHIPIAHHLGVAVHRACDRPARSAMRNIHQRQSGLRLAPQRPQCRRSLVRRGRAATAWVRCRSWRP